MRSDLFAEDAERQLHARAADVAKEADQYKREGRYREALQDIAGLRPEVDRFFDDVMVMAEDEQVRKNRLTLLSGIAFGIFDDCGFFGNRDGGEVGMC